MLATFSQLLCVDVLLPIHIVWCCWLNGIAQFAMNIWKLCFMMWNKWPQMAATEEAVAKVYLDLDQFMGISECQSAFNCKNVIIFIRVAFCRYMPQQRPTPLHHICTVCHPLWLADCCCCCNLTFSLIIALSFSLCSQHLNAYMASWICIATRENPI